MERLYLAMADVTRLRLINLMRGGEVCVNDLEQTLNESQPKISRHLAYLRNAGVVTARRDGRYIFYSIDRPDKDDAANSVIRTALEWMASDAKMIDEYSRLKSTNKIIEILPTATKKKSVKVNKPIALEQDLINEPVLDIEEEYNDDVDRETYERDEVAERQQTFFHNELDDFLL